MAAPQGGGEAGKKVRGEGRVGVASNLSVPLVHLAPSVLDH